MANCPDFSTPNAQLQAEAASENTSQERLRELVKISTVHAQVVASNVNVEPELLRELAASGDDATRQNVVSNPNTPTDVLWELGKEFPVELWENPVFSLLLLENPNLIEEIPYLLQVENVPISLLEWGAEYQFDEPQLYVTMNPKTPKSILERLIERKWDRDIVTAAKQHINFAGEISEGWEEIVLTAMKSTELEHYHYGDYKELWQVGAIDEFYAPAVNEDLQLNIAKNPNTSEKVLQALAENCDRNFLRKVIVENPNTPVSLLEDWLGDSNLSIIQAVTCHPKISLQVLIKFYTQHKIVKNLDTVGEVLKQLATSRWGSIRHRVFEHRNTPKDVREQLTEFIKYNEGEEEISDFLGSEDDYDFDDYEESILEKVLIAKNPDTPINILEELAIKNDVIICQALAKNANVPPSILEKLAIENSSCLDILEAVAENYQTPAIILELLGSNEDNRIQNAIAHNPNTPLHVLEKIASTQDYHIKGLALESIKNYVVRNIENPILAAEWLSGDLEKVPGNQYSLILKVLIQHPDASTTLLQKVAEIPDNDYEVKSAIAYHHNTPEIILEKMAEDESDRVRYSVATNSTTPIHILQKLVADSEDFVRKTAFEQLCENHIFIPNAPASVLQQLVETNDWQVKISVARHPNTPATALEELAKSSNEKVRQVVAQNANTKKAVAQLLQDTDKDVRAAALTNPNLPQSLTIQLEHLKSQKLTQDTLTQLAFSQWVVIRERVALHADTSLDILKKLATDNHIAVLVAVASNPSTPQNIKLLDTLTANGITEIDIAVASNPNTPISLLEEIAKKQISTSHNQAVKEAAIKNMMQRSPEIATKYLEKFASNLTSPSFIRLLVFMNPHAPVSLLIKYYRSTSWLERYAVASNPSTPVRILDCLSKDANRVVRAAAKANFQYSYKIHP